MKGRKDILDHVAAATGVARADVAKVVDAAFAYVRESAVGGAGVAHPSLGRIRVRTRTAEGGETKQVYRYVPDPEARRRGGRRGKPAPEAE
jgi:nucleoid DNA-binding protein